MSIARTALLCTSCSLTLLSTPASAQACMPTLAQLQRWSIAPEMLNAQRVRPLVLGDYRRPVNLLPEPDRSVKVPLVPCKDAPLPPGSN